MSKLRFAKPILGISALSGTGKTELLTKLIPLLKQQGLSIAVIKHAHHNVDIDKPGKDSYRLREAGATPVVLASDQRIALMIEKQSPQASPLEELLQLINPASIDLVLIEGFKELDYNKLFLFRHEIKDRYKAIDETVLSVVNAASTLAIVTDIESQTMQMYLETEKPVLDINNTNDVLQYIVNYINTEKDHE